MLWSTSGVGQKESAAHQNNSFPGYIISQSRVRHIKNWCTIWTTHECFEKAENVLTTTAPPGARKQLRRREQLSNYGSCVGVRFEHDD